MRSLWETGRRVLGAVALLTVTGCGPHAVGNPASSGEAAGGRPVPTPLPPPSHEAAVVQRSTGPARPCRAADLDAHFRPEGEGATGHYANLLDLRNVSRARCVLSGYPVGVSLSEPGHRTVRTARGAFFDPLPPRPMYPGGVTTLVIESDTYCGARPSGGPPGPIYRHATVRLNHGVVRATTRGARGIDVGCGAFVSQFGRWLGAS